MKEIGSEFCFDSGIYLNTPSVNSWLPFLKDYAFTFSGRTAIDIVINDIKSNKNISKVLFPSYSCKSMVVPFEKNNIQISFYDLDFSSGLQDFLIPDDCDIVFLCNYFGYCQTYNEETLKRFRKNGGIIIEDVTHSLLSYKQYCKHSDYLVASLRKWGGILCGGFCSKKDGCFSVLPHKKPSEQYLEIKKQAMQMKEQYLSGDDSVDKQSFIDLFSCANNMLSNEYEYLAIDKHSEDILLNWNVEKIREKRVKNAKTLYQEIEEIPGLSFLFSEEELDCPLFVPIVVDEQKRDLLRQALIEQKIYCPVHWPKPFADSDFDLYKTELSLICDQRYNEQDMRFIADIITNFARCNL